MYKSKQLSWQRLDNAAKIFPPTSNKKDTKVFRFSCRLYETINPNTLQLALDKTMLSFPLYASIIRKGLFWYYFEASTIKPLVSIESKPPCSVLYDENTKHLLFEVTYYKKRINLEIYHALTDGVGALQFLKTLVLNYLILEHQKDFKNQIPSIDYDASISQKEDDSFQKYFNDGAKSKKSSIGTAYKLKGETLEDNILQVITGVVSAKEVLNQAHQYNTTLTVFLSAVLVYSIGQEMSMTDKKRPVVLSVPVNLRAYFQSASARNFFSVINIPYNFSKEDATFEDVIKYLHNFFEKELTADNFRARLNNLVALEHNYFTRAIPLFFKKPTLRIAHHLTNKEITTVLSNIGRVSMPTELEPYIDLFDVCVSTAKVQMCLCSYKDKLSISFSAPFVSTEIQKNFFRALTAQGISVAVATNITD
ncbi:MAG: hypothetical protein AB9856_00620 [Cellulosilyticaceae bacterium]